MRGILCFSSTFTLTLSHDDGSSGDGDDGSSSDGDDGGGGSFAVETSGMSGLWTQVHSLEETVLISYRTFTTFLSFYHSRARPNGFS